MGTADMQDLITEAVSNILSAQIVRAERFISPAIADHIRSLTTAQLLEMQTAAKQEIRRATVAEDHPRAVLVAYELQLINYHLSIS